MAKVVLIDPPWEMQDGNILKKVGGYMPTLGLLYMAAFLERQNHEVKIIDCTAENITTAKLTKIFGDMLYLEEQPDFIGLTATTPLIKNAIAICQKAKKYFPKCKTILGGVHPSAMPEECLQHPGVDFVVRGEGEDSIMEIVSGQDPKTIQGISYKEQEQMPTFNPKTHHNPARTKFTQYDKFPMPAYHLINLKNYRPPIGSYKQLPAMSVFATRGCPGKCTFCCSKLIFPACRFRSGRSVFKEVKHLHEKYGIKEIHFYDDAFTMHKEYMLEFCMLMCKYNKKITWSCFSRADHLDEIKLKAMKLAGCHLILFGVESADEKILENIKKNIPIQKVKDAIRMCRETGIETRPSFMIGNPGETEETIKKTIQFSKDLDPDFAQFSITTVYPGTEMWEWAKEKGYLISTSYDQYYVNTPTMNLPGLPPEKLKYYHKLAYRSFYFRPKIIWRLIKSLRSWTQLVQLVKGGFALVR